MKHIFWMGGLLAVCAWAGSAHAQDDAMTNDTMPDMSASGVDIGKGQLAGTDQVKVIMPDGSTLMVNNYTDNPWWKDKRLEGYTRYVFDPEQNAYKMMKDGDTTNTKPFCDHSTKKDWCQ